MILSHYDFVSNKKLMLDANKAIELIVKHNISKYNNAFEFDGIFSIDLEMTERVLIVAQRAGDASLEHGMLYPYTTADMINAAITENKDAVIWLKIHPDVLSGKKNLI